MTKELSPSEYKQRLASDETKQPSGLNYLKPAIAVVVVAALCGGSFIAGQNYQKTDAGSSETSATTQPGPQGMGGPSGFGDGQRPTVGQVTAVTSDSIIITSNRTNTDQTLKITGSTTIDNNGSTASIEDVKVGDTVLIQVDSSDSSTATRIMLNPSMMQGPAASSSSETNNTNTTNT